MIPHYPERKEQIERFATEALPRLRGMNFRSFGRNFPYLRINKKTIYLIPCSGGQIIHNSRKELLSWRIYPRGAHHHRRNH